MSKAAPLDPAQFSLSRHGHPVQNGGIFFVSKSLGVCVAAEPADDSGPIRIEENANGPIRIEENANKHFLELVRIYPPPYENFAPSTRQLLAGFQQLNISITFRVVRLGTSS